MIAQRSERLRELVNAYKDAAGSAAEAQRLTNSLQAIQAVVADLKRSQPPLRALSQSSLITTTPSLTSPKQAVKAARAAVADGAAREFVATEECGRLLEVLRGTADEARTQVIQAWQNFATSQQQEVPADLLAALALVDRYRTMAERAQDAAGRLTETISGSGPLPTEAQIEAAVNARGDLESALAEIQSSVPVPVQAALRRCMSREGLPVDEVSDEFRKWMSDHEVERSFVIRIR